MLPKKNKLSTKEFQSVFKKGKSLRSETFFIKYLDNNLERARIGVGVTKKLGKNAVQKNRHKRVLRHILKNTLKDANTGYDIVLIANENAENKTFKELQKEAYELLHKTTKFK